MRFSYSKHMQETCPDRKTAVVHVDHVRADVEASTVVAELTKRAQTRLTAETEGSMVEIRSWRAAYSIMGLKPTQYRCASEALLRRLRKAGELPSLHPLVDICNAMSIAYAIPVAVFDLDRIVGDLCVREANGNETFAAFSGKTETPDKDEVIFADDGGFAHARRWANRQSRLSAVSPTTKKALIVSEALHPNCETDLRSFAREIQGLLKRMSFSPREIELLLSPDAEYRAP